MKHFVLDSSVALAWCFEDETRQAADQILDLLQSAQAGVPMIWPAEVGNALLTAERRKRISAADVARSLALLRSLNIRLDDSDARLEADEWVALARSQKLPVYDAAYLSVAIRSGMASATFDRALAGAARRLHIRLVQS